ncbi:hypothetical protein ABT282_06965 [Streptomyces sp. NPDC000927]|uniref:hypothetical protein n=1 Tax=Streptomyces sp. NPDC000927 TaxID=3154371 RepID=UPI0033256ABD
MPKNPEKPRKDVRAHEVATHLAQRIETGEWPRTGSEDERRFLTRDQIRSEYETTLATVDAVIRILRTKGLIVTRQGMGTFTRPPKPHRLTVPGQDDGVWTKSDVPVRESMEALSWVKGELSLDDGDDVHRTRWVLSRNGEVYAIADAYSAVEDAEIEVVEGVAAWSRVRTWLPSDDEARVLGMPQEVPVLAFLNPVENGVVVRIFPGDRAEGCCP